MLESTCSERLEMPHTLSIVLPCLHQTFLLIALPVGSTVNELSFDLSKSITLSTSAVVRWELPGRRARTRESERSPSRCQHLRHEVDSCLFVVPVAATCLALLGSEAIASRDCSAWSSFQYLTGRLTLPAFSYRITLPEASLLHI